MMDSLEIATLNGIEPDKMRFADIFQTRPSKPSDLVFPTPLRPSLGPTPGSCIDPAECDPSHPPKSSCMTSYVISEYRTSIRSPSITSSSISSSVESSLRSTVDTIISQKLEMLTSIAIFGWPSWVLKYSGSPQVIYFLMRQLLLCGYSLEGRKIYDRHKRQWEWEEANEVSENCQEDGVSSTEPQQPPQ